MIFNTDKQTLEDLNIFGKRGKESIFSLFNRTYTAGGSKALEELFLYPKTGVDIVQERSETILYFFDASTVFPLETGWVDTIVHYLSDRDTRSQLSSNDDTLERKFQNLMGNDNQFKHISKSLQIVGKCFECIQNFIQKATLSSKHGYFYEESREVLAILSEEKFNAVVKAISSSKLSYEDTASYDRFIRFNNYELVQKVMNFIYQLDLYIAIATVARERGFTFAKPVESDVQQISIRGFYHPLLPNAKGNTLNLFDTQPVLFLTGANMAGKSTFMKSLGITVFLAHLGMPIPAEEMTFTIQDGIYTTINLSDNLEMGHSHFYAEVSRVKKVSVELTSGKRLFVIFDELFRGTNVKDAYDATVAITHLYSKLKNCFFVVSTHIIEAADELKTKTNAIQYAYMPTIMEGNTPKYTYNLTPGVTSDRHGMLIINNENIIDILAKGKGKHAI